MRLILWPAIVAHFIAYGAFMLVTPLYALRLGASTATIGLIVSLGFLLPLLLALPVGAALPRIGLRRPLLAGPAMVVCGAAIPLLGRGLGPLAIAEVLVGLGHLGIVLAGQTAVSTLGTAADGEANFGAYGASVAAGQMVGPILAGIIGDAAGVRTAFAVTMGAGLLAGAILVLGRRSLIFVPLPAGRRSKPPWLAPVRSPALRYAMVVSGLMVLVRTAHSTYLPVFLARHSFSSATIGAFVALLALVTVLVRPLLPAVSAAFGGQARSTIGALGLTLVGIAGMAIPPSWLSLTAMTLLLGTGVGLGQPLSMVLASASSGVDDRALALGYRLTVNRLTQLVTPALLGVVASAVGVGTVFIVSAGVVGVALPVLTRLRSIVATAAAPARAGETPPRR